MTITWRPADSFTGNTSDPEAVRARACPVCGHDVPELLLTFRDFQFFTDDAVHAKRVEIRNVRCSSCETVYLDPVFTPRGFATLFAEAGCSYGATAGRADEQMAWLRERGLLSPGSRLLDVGCYDGAFLAGLPSSIRRVGVDIDAPAIARARRQWSGHGIEFVCGDFDAFSLSGTVDTMVMFHVLEHLPDPVRTLRHLRTMAHPATHLIVEVPIVQNGFTNDINGFLSAQHLTHFSRQSLTNTLATAGWKITARVEQSDYNGCRVVARPADAPRAIVPDRADAECFARYLDHWREVTQAVSARLEPLAEVRDVVVWGAGLHTEFLYHTTPLFANRDRRYVIVDSDVVKQGRSWRGIEVHAPDVLADIDWSSRKLLVSSYGGQRSIVAAATARAVPATSIVTLYDQFRLY